MFFVSEGDRWIQASVFIPAGKRQIVFNGVVGPGGVSGDIALDDIVLYSWADGTTDTGGKVASRR